MNLAELKLKVDAALERGTDPETTVVAATGGWYTEVDDVTDPTDQEGLENGYIWFTLNLGEDADARFTVGHNPTEEQWNVAHGLPAQRRG